MENNFHKLAKLSLVLIYIVIIAGAFVRMTGSGSAIIAYFNSDKSCDDAEKKVKKKFKNYWCKTSKTI